MIIDVRKYVVLGTQEDLDLFFERAQQNGFMEFISAASKKNAELPADAHDLFVALKILRKLPLRKKYEGLWELSYASHIAKRIIELRDEIEKLEEEKRLTDAEMHRVAPFGDFSIQDIDFIRQEGKRVIQFFCVKTDKQRALVCGNELIYVGTEYDLDYFIGINPEPRSYTGMIEMRIDRSEPELKTHLLYINEAIHNLEVELKSYAGHKEFLYQALLEQMNTHNLTQAKQEVATPLPSSSIFSIEAWVPRSKESLIPILLEGLSVHCERIKREEQDQLPTYLENKGVNLIGEDLVKIYDVPATTDKDPSGWVFWSFALFFAMIVSDGGYGLLYLGLALYMKYKVKNLKGQVRRFIKLAIILSSFVVVWGVLTSSFFGLRIDRHSFLGRLSPMQYMTERKAQYHLDKKDDVYDFWLKEFPTLKTATTGDEFIATAATLKNGIKTYEASDDFADSILLEFSLIIGVIHLSGSFLRYLRRNWAGLGWIAFMIGAYLFFPIKLSAISIVQFMGWIEASTAGAFGIQLLYTGIGVAVVLALIQKRWKGISEILNMIQVFADVLSYLRLYALALAGMIMATTFNDMGMTVGLLGGFIVILAGHAVNILLGIMAGVIHGLRLNFIEWYHFSFDGGGRLFKPLKLLKSEEE
ncbi:MAG: V-type ATP synthase subunit I [Chlamydiae bacterium]|nr:V-type ATP synthase subunit I [Chlamydiota bacterium]